MKSQITCTWNPATVEETKVTFSDDYKNLHPVAKLDFLLDAMASIEAAYNAVHEKEYGF